MRFPHLLQTRREVLKSVSAAAGFSLLGPLGNRALAQDTLSPATVLANGAIVTLDPTRPRAEAIAVRNGVVLAVGETASVREAAGKDATEIDLAGRTVIPGLNDSHMHPTRGGRFYALELRWDGVNSLARGIEMIREQAKRTPRGQWVRVIGSWSPYQFEENRLPKPRELTEAAPDTPVFVLFLYSQAYLNAAGVRALGITAENAAQKAPAGTRYELTPDGGAVLYAEPNPTILYQTVGALPSLTAEHQALSTRHFYRELARFGLTSVIDAGGGGHVFPEDYAGTQALADQGEMPIRISSYLFPHTPSEELATFRQWTDSYAVNVNMAKRLQDGFVVEGAGEFLVWSAGDFENFMAPRPNLSDRPGWDRELMEVTRHLLQARWPIRIHATYDESIRGILDVFEAAHQAEREAGRPGFRGIRWAIDHAETVGGQSLGRIARLGGGIAIQARMAYAGEFFAERYGDAAAADAPPVADIIAAGIPVGMGTDATRVASYNPWAAIDWLTTGRTVGGTTLMGARHRRSRAEALYLYTVGSAWFSGEEARKGRLAPGQLADLAVLNADYLKVGDDDLKHIESMLTMVGGIVVHGTEEFVDLASTLPPIEPNWSPVRHFGGYQSKR